MLPLASNFKLPTSSSILTSGYLWRSDTIRPCLARPWSVRAVPAHVRDVFARARDVPARVRDVPARARDVPVTCPWCARPCSWRARDVPARARDVPARARDVLVTFGYNPTVPSPLVPSLCPIRPCPCPVSPYRAPLPGLARPCRAQFARAHAQSVPSPTRARAQCVPNSCPVLARARAEDWLVDRLNELIYKIWNYKLKYLPNINSKFQLTITFVSKIASKHNT